MIALAEEEILERPMPPTETKALLIFMPDVFSASFMAFLML